MRYFKNIKKVDWLLLIFLVLFTNQAVLSLKIVGLVLIYILRPDFKFGLRKDRIPLFFLLIPIVSLLNLFINKDFSKAYLCAFAVGNAFWILCFLAYHQFKLSLEKSGTATITRTLQAYALLNALAVVWQLVTIILITGKVNPYRGLDFPYGISTGDHIYGILWGNAYNNLMISSILAIFFLYNRKFNYFLLSIICALLVFGNAGTIILFTVLVLIIITAFINGIVRRITKKAKTRIEAFLLPRRETISIFLMIVFALGFYYIVSPDNIKYTAQRLFSKKSPDSKAIPLSYYKDKLRADDTTDKEWRKSMTENFVYNYKGKKLSFIETYFYLKHSPKAFLIGAGTANFSSLTAQRMSGLDSSRIFRKILPYYCAPLYERNHRLINIVRLSSKPEYLSQTNNWPNSTYNQLLGEYGIIGTLIFIFFYVGYYLRKIRYWSWGLWLSVLIVAFSFFDYMFEPLCVMIFYELCMETDIMANKAKRSIL